MGGGRLKSDWWLGTIAWGCVSGGQDKGYGHGGDTGTQGGVGCGALESDRSVGGVFIGGRGEKLVCVRVQ